MKKYLFVILSLSVILVLFLYGCCSKSGGSGVFVNVSGDSEIIYREIAIDEKGRLLTPVAFPSGTTIKATEEMTLQPGIKVTLAEQKITSDNSRVFDNSQNASVYLYKITAVMKSDNPLVSDTTVTTLEKPFTVTY